ncbi:MAG TPA: abortive infection family protein [Actinomycetota bacterium]|nr:abortive infection family protein [Actinomycetota bacterium]
MQTATVRRVAPLTDAIVFALSHAVNDSQAEKREPTHSDLLFLFQSAQLEHADLPKSPPVGKAKRVRAVLSWALENDLEKGGRLVTSLLASIRGCGGFRVGSPNFIGADAIDNLNASFASEGFEVTQDGELQPLLLDDFVNPATPDVLASYARRAARGVADAVLVVGTGKDLIEATAAYVLVKRRGAYQERDNFPTLLGEAFTEAGLATPQTPATPAEPKSRSFERRLFEAACEVSRLRNKEGSGHGRPFVPTVSDAHARAAAQTAGTVAELLLQSIR